MIRVFLALLPLAAACSSDVELDLDEPAPETPSAPAPLPDPSLGELAWSFTDPGLLDADTQHLERAADGSVIAAGTFRPSDASLPGTHAFLARLSRDGAPMWLTEIGNQELVDLVGGFGLEVQGAQADIASIDSFDDGRILVALNFRASLTDGSPPDSASDLAFLRWYDADGNLLETRLFRDEDDIASLPEQPFSRTQLTNVLAFPDGGGVHARLTQYGISSRRTYISRFDADGDEVWTKVVEGSSELANLTATPDGGILFDGQFSDPGTVGDPTVCPPAVGPFIARLELDDGRCSWVTSFKGADYLLPRGGIGLAAGGNVVATGRHGGRVRAGELEIQSADELYVSFVAELGPDGDVLRLNAVELLPPGALNDRVLESASVGDETVLTSGFMTDFTAFVEQRPAFIAIFDLDGRLLAERRLDAGDDERNRAVATRAIIMPDRGVLAGGFWDQQIDLGDGEVVESAVPGARQLFVARYGPIDDGTVDRVTP